LDQAPVGPEDTSGVERTLDHFKKVRGFSAYQ